MALRLLTVVLACAVAGAAAARSLEVHSPVLETKVEALFAGDRPIAEIKLALDHIVAPTVDVNAGLADIKTLQTRLETMRAAAHATSDRDRINVLRQFLYEAGPWNGGKAFSYDLDDPLGREPQNRLLTDYLADRKGNCVSMPLLFMILGQSIGLQMTLAEAPKHSLVKFTDSEGRQWNLEATSGGGFTRDSHYQQLLPGLTDAAIAHGVYLRGLPKAEMIAFLVSGELVAQLMSQGRLEDALAVTDRLITHAPGSVHLKLTRASILSLMLKRDIIDRYPRASDIPPDERAWADELYRQNIGAFRDAEALGWRDPSGQL